MIFEAKIGVEVLRMLKNLNFKDFLVLENNSYFSTKVADILAGAQEIEQNVQGMGLRELSKSCEILANQIRRILHSHWPRELTPQLEELQKIGVAILRAIEEKGDLRELIPAISSNLKNLSGKLDQPVNQLSVE